MKNQKKRIEREEGVAEEKRGIRIPFMRIMIGLVLLVVIGYFGFTCEVREGSCAVILRFGAPRAEITEAGLYFKLPWPFETVTTYDNRLQYLESNHLETTTKDNRNIILQCYALWSIEDPLKFHNSIGSQERVEAYINDQIFSATNGVLGSYELKSLVSLDREEIKSDEMQEKIFQAVKTTCEANYGISINDVSILRISLPDTNLESVFEQMRADRQKDIDSILAQANKEADKIMSDADTKYSEIISGAQIEAADINAKTEAEVARIYAEAQSANVELYKLLKEFEAIIQSVSYESVLIVEADKYPFNVLWSYGDMLTDESNEMVVKDLDYILKQLPEADRYALIDAVYQLILQAGGNRS